MKSFLVDALRQSVDAGSDDQSAKHPVEAREVAESAAGQAAHFDAMELGLLDHRDEAVSANTDQFGPPDSDACLEVVDEAGESDSRPFAATALLDSRGAMLSSKVPVYERAGRLAPVLCLVAMSAAAGGYMLLNSTADSIYVESRRYDGVRPDSAARPKPGRWQDLPATDVSAVTRAEARNAFGAVPVAETAAVTGSANTVDVPTNTGSAEPARSRARNSIQIGVTRNVDSIVNDRAFASVRTAFDAYQAQDYSTAESHYHQALEIEPYHADALAGLAAVYQQTGRVALATDAYQRLLGVDPGNTRAASAIIALRSKDADWETESDLKYLLQRFPGAHHLHFALGSYFVEQRRWADARHEFLAAHELAPRNADYSFNVAVSMENLGEHNNARSYYEMALEMAGESSNVDKDAVTEHLSVMLAQSRARQ
jgi:tetratricopeptide (TPR) repeat protein